jgi:hypothetical protein
MFGRKPEYMLDNPAARWRVMPGLEPELRGHPAPDYISRRASGAGPSYGEGFGSPIGGDRDRDNFRCIDPDAPDARFRPPVPKPCGIHETYHGPVPGFQTRRDWRG